MRAEHSVEERRFVVNGIRLLSRTWGEPDGRHVLYWHGLAHTARASQELNEVGPVLASRYGLQIVAVDVPGFGGSPALEADGYHPHALAALFPTLLDALEVERAAFIGASWGGHIGCHVAARYADRLTGLVLLDGGYRDPWYDASLPFAAHLAESERAWEAERVSSKVILDDARGHRGRLKSSVEAAARPGWRKAEDGFVPAVSPAVVAAAKYGIARAPPSTTWAELERTAVPILLVAAGETPEDDLARFAAAVPQAEIHRASGAGHDVLGEGGPAVLSIIGAWLGRLPFHRE
jgi:pimeloyl-ACP methyl ester carboxylesterase